MRSKCALLLVLLCVGCPNVGCGVGTRQELALTSPDGAHIATLDRTGGPGTSPVTQVNIRRKGRPNVFPFVTTALDIDGGYEIGLKWQASDQLVISCPACDPQRVVTQLDRVGALTVAYPSFGSTVSPRWGETR